MFKSVHMSPDMELLELVQAPVRRYRSPAVVFPCMIGIPIREKGRFLRDVSKSEQGAIEKHNAEIDRSLGELKKELESLREPHERRIFEAKLSRVVRQALQADVRTAFQTAAGKRNNVQKYLVEKLEAELKVPPEEVVRALAPADKSRSDRLLEKIKTVEGWRQSTGRIEAVWDVGTPPAIHVLRRGSLDIPGAEVRPGFVSLLSERGKSDFVRPAATQARRVVAAWLLPAGSHAAITH